MTEMWEVVTLETLENLRQGDYVRFTDRNGNCTEGKIYPLMYSRHLWRVSLKGNAIFKMSGSPAVREGRVAVRRIVEEQR